MVFEARGWVTSSVSPPDKAGNDNRSVPKEGPSHWHDQEHRAPIRRQAHIGGIMFYQAKVTHDDDTWLAEFPDCPGCQTEADTEDELLAMAKEALHGWLEVSMEHGDVPIAPRHHGVQGFMRVDVPPDLAVRLQLRLARHNAGLSQDALAKRVGVTQQQIAKLEHPESNASITTLAKVAAALGMTLDVRFEKVA